MRAIGGQITFPQNLGFCFVHAPSLGILSLTISRAPEQQTYTSRTHEVPLIDGVGAQGVDFCFMTDKLLFFASCP